MDASTAGDHILKLSRIFDIKNVSDIDGLYNLCMGSEAETIKFRTSYVYNLIEFIKAGFVPANYEFKRALFEYVNGRDLKTIEFWFSESGFYILDFLFENDKWIFNKLSLQIQNATKFGRSYELTLYAPNYVYKSQRPKTDMSLFRGAGSRVTSIASIGTVEILLDGEEWSILPVTRYAAGMSRSLFFNDDTEEKYCGTFYYLEPESKTLLAHKTVKSFFNKTAAMMELDPEWMDKEEAQQFLEQNYNIRDHISGKLPADLMMTPLEYFNHNRSKNTKDPYFWRRLNEMNHEDVASLPQKKEYIGEVTRMYAVEDEFDQRICELGSSKGIDVIILTHMVGSHQVVTEILDTRDRTDSFKSLVFIE